MTRRNLWLAALAAAGLCVYLWPALRAPVVLWSDSAIDLDWAKQGIGILSVAPAPPSPHPAKPGWLAFLRLGTGSGSADDAARRIVLMQSILVWLSIAATSLLLSRRIGAGAGVALYAILILFLRLRDATSAVMSEALSAAILLPILALLLAPPRRSIAFPLGLSIAALFLVRPNVGAVALVLALCSFALARTPGRAVLLLLGFVLLWLPVWIATGPGDDRLRGLGPAFTAAQADYGWVTQGKGTKAAMEDSAFDWRRQLVWRAFHGPMGIEYYDARWSGLYRSLTTASRQISPFLILASIAILLAAPLQGEGRQPKLLGLALLAMLIVQSVALGALPRFALPLLPALFVLAAASLPPLWRSPALLRLACLVVFAALLLAAAWQSQVLDWEWGLVEASGVGLTQEIARGSLPATGPATLHIRIASPLPDGGASLDILGPRGERLSAREDDAARRMPYLTIALPESVLEENRRGPVSIGLRSRGGYDATHYLLFPVIPPPWASPARRDTSAELSPATGIGSGALDWWAHPGAP